MNFRKLGLIAAIVFTTGIAFSLFAPAQRGGRIYDASTETTVHGTVTAVNSVTGRRGWNGVHLTIQNGDEKSEVHIGPSTYVSSKGFTFAAGDQVDVLGSRVTVNGVPSLIAREITKDGKVLTLRDKQGFPLWSRASQ
jgi:hypothetical protein